MPCPAVADEKRVTETEHWVEGNSDRNASAWVAHGLCCGVYSKRDSRRVVLRDIPAFRYADVADGLFDNFP
jgi:hypothetical protein